MSRSAPLQVYKQLVYLVANACTLRTPADPKFRRARSSEPICSVARNNYTMESSNGMGHPSDQIRIRLPLDWPNVINTWFQGQRTPAVVRSHSLMEFLLEWPRNQQNWQRFSELVEKRQASIEERIAEIDVRMANVRQHQARRSEVEARLRKSHREISKLKDERDYLATFLDRLDENADSAQGRLAKDLLSKVSRSRLSQRGTDELVESAFDAMFDAYVDDQAQDETSRTSEESSRVYSPSVILSEINHYFRKVADARKDE